MCEFTASTAKCETTTKKQEVVPVSPDLLRVNGVDVQVRGKAAPRLCAVAAFKPRARRVPA